MLSTVYWRVINLTASYAATPPINPFTHGFELLPSAANFSTNWVSCFHIKRGFIWSAFVGYTKFSVWYYSNALIATYKLNRESGSPSSSRSGESNSASTDLKFWTSIIPKAAFSQNVLITSYDVSKCKSCYKSTYSYSFVNIYRSLTDFSL